MSIILEGADKVKDWLDKQSEAAKDAYKTAVKVEGYRLASLLKSDIKHGAPGGNTLKPLTYIAMRMARKVRGAGTFVRQNPNRKPLANLATGIRYAVTNSPFSMSIGFVQPVGRSNQISKSWRRLGEIQQSGFSTAVTKEQRKAFARRGGELGTIEGGNTPFFLRKSTTHLNTPARPIISPFWYAHKAAAMSNISSNFKSKMAGNRI